MKERPILFSAPMIRAILEGRKTQTRRIVKPQPELNDEYRPSRIDRYTRHPEYHWPSRLAQSMVTISEMSSLGPYGAPGDRLWVREAFTQITGNGIRVHYRADGEPLDSDGKPLPTRPGTRRWWPSIHMSRKQSRITLEVTGVRVERLHEISDSDARAEGLGVSEAPGVWIPPDGRRMTYAQGAFRSLWCDINGAESWDANPWVWVVEFRRVDQVRNAAEAGSAEFRSGEAQP